MNRPFLLVHFADLFMLASTLFNEQNKGPSEYYHMICIGKTKCTSEKGLLLLCVPMSQYHIMNIYVVKCL